MAQATEAGRVGTVVKEAERGLRMEALWERAWPEELANKILPPMVVLARFTLGWVFAYAGFHKLIMGFSAGGYLGNATKGPLTGWFHSLASNSMALNVIDPMVTWGEILIGLALVFGVFTRWAALWGSVMLMLFYLSAFPPENNPFLEYHLVYIVALGILSALGAGRILGLDYFVERLPLVKRLPGVKFVLG